jgi:hypothetical protein
LWSLEVEILPDSVARFGTTVCMAEATVLPAFSVENGFDLVWLGLRLLTPLRPIYCSFNEQF